MVKWSNGKGIRMKGLKERLRMRSQRLEGGLEMRLAYRQACMERKGGKKGRHIRAWQICVFPGYTYYSSFSLTFEKVESAEEECPCEDDDEAAWFFVRASVNTSLDGA